MLPVTRATLDYICSICLVDIRPSIYTKKVYDVGVEKDLCKLLKLTAHIAVLRNPMNQTFIDEYCRKICELCYVKSQYSFNFREKILASTIAVKEILENEDIDDDEIEKLQSFCRICLYRQNCTHKQTLTKEFLKWLKDCSGLRFTSLIETDVFRLKEGTNITELMVVHDALFPKQLCQKCIKNLRNMEDFRNQATQSFEYLVSVMGDGGKSPTDILHNFHYGIKKENQKAQGQSVFKSEVCPQNEIKIEKEGLMCQESRDSELYQYYINEFSDDSLDDDLTFETKFLDTDIIIDEKNNPSITAKETQDHPSITIDPIGKDENIVQSTNSRKLLNRKFKNVTTIKDRTAKTKYSDHGQDFKKECLSDLDDSDDSTNLLSLQTRLRRSGISKPKKKDNKNIDQENKGIKNEVVSSPMEDPIELLSDNPSNNRNNEKTIPQKLKPTKKAKQSQSEKDKDVDQNFECDQCAKSFHSSYVLKRHIKDMHSPMEDNTCAICSKAFRRKHHLKSHIKTVHEKVKPFKCSYCDIAFATRTIKRVHELSHSDTFPFVCDWCARRFRTSSQLKIHTEVHTTQPELLCPICKRAQTTGETLQEHLKTHEEKRLQCPSCGKFFKNSTHLRDHQNAVHLKLRPFKCEFCDSAFGDRKTRTVHEKSHTEDRPEKCSICNLGFKSRSTLGKHIKQLGHFSDEFLTKKQQKKLGTHKEAVKHFWHDGQIPF